MEYDAATDVSNLSLFYSSILWLCSVASKKSTKLLSWTEQASVCIDCTGKREREREYRVEFCCKLQHVPSIPSLFWWNIEHWSTTMAAWVNFYLFYIHSPEGKIEEGTGSGCWVEFSFIYEGYFMQPVCQEHSGSWGIDPGWWVCLRVRYYSYFLSLVHWVFT